MNRMVISVLEILVTATVAGLTTSAGLLAMVHERVWIDAVFVFVVPFLTTIGVGLRNLYKDNPHYN